MMPKTALIHIGTPKTGTTSIQECLARAECDGSLRPYRYPLFRGDREHNRLTMLYLPHQEQPAPRRVEFPRDDERFRRTQLRYRQFLFRILRSSGGAILSGEVLSNCFGPAAAGQLRRDLESLGFRQFHIVLYVREPADFYLSRTQSQLKLPVHPSPAVADPMAFRYRFRRIAENWEQAFPDRVIVRRYPSGPQHNVLEDFSDLTQKCLRVTLPRSQTRLNTTLSAEGMAVMQDYRQAVGTDSGGLAIPGLDRLVAFLAQSVQCLPQTKPKLKADVAEEIRANHTEDAEFLKSRYGVDLGLGGSAGLGTLSAHSSWRVEDILESVDREIVQRLLEEFGQLRQRPLPVRIATKAYRSVPLSRRPARLDAWLRSRFGEGPSA
jgi:hypothetical protein